MSDKQVRQHGAMEYSRPPADLNAVRLYRLNRVREQLKRLDYAGILLFDQINTRYACDATNMQIWCSHFETRCLFVATEGPMVLFDYGYYPHLVEGLDLIDDYRVHNSSYYFAAANRGDEKVGLFANDIADLVANHGAGNKRLAIDRLSYPGSQALVDKGLSIHDGQEVMELARVIKSDEEVVLMQKSIDVCEIAMAEMHKGLVPGVTENALWSILHQKNIELGGEWIETRLLSSGERTQPWFRECSLRAIAEGDLVSFDTDLIGPYGYCADISRSWLCGDVPPSAEQKRIYQLAVEQNEFNKALIKPGVSFRDISKNAWPIPKEFIQNRYSVLMHGVGLADEYPSIKHWCDFEKLGYDGTLEAGMTLCVESYIGSETSGMGVKLEEQVLVTDDGIRQLSRYPLEDALQA
jgi:Xaa-Pro dipeptidase